MAGITLADAQAQLDVWLAASISVAANQSYTMSDGRSLTRANAAWIQKQVVFWEAKVASLSQPTRGRRVRQAAVR